MQSPDFVMRFDSVSAPSTVVPTTQTSSGVSGSDVAQPVANPAPLQAVLPSRSHLHNNLPPKARLRPIKQWVQLRLHPLPHSELPLRPRRRAIGIIAIPRKLTIPTSSSVQFHGVR